MKVAITGFEDLSRFLIKNPDAAVASNNGQIYVYTGASKLAHKYHELKRFLKSDLSYSQFFNKRKVEVVDVLHRERITCINKLRAGGTLCANRAWHNFGRQDGHGVFNRRLHPSHTAVSLVTSTFPNKEIKEKAVIKACQKLAELENDYYFVFGHRLEFNPSTDMPQHGN